MKVVLKQIVRNESEMFRPADVALIEYRAISSITQRKQTGARSSERDRQWVISDNKQ